MAGAAGRGEPGPIWELSPQQAHDVTDRRGTGTGIAGVPGEPIERQLEADLIPPVAPRPVAQRQVAERRPERGPHHGVESGRQRPGQPGPRR